MFVPGSQILQMFQLNLFLFNRSNQEVKKQHTASIVSTFMLIHTKRDLYVSSSIISEYNFDIKCKSSAYSNYQQFNKLSMFLDMCTLTCTNHKY